MKELEESPSRKPVPLGKKKNSKIYTNYEVVSKGAV
jgi:hypothetical protein